MNVKLRPRATEPWTDRDGNHHERLRVSIPGRPGTYLPEGGAIVELSSYWRRRLAAGDVETCEEQAAPSRPAARAPKAQKD